MTMKYSQESSKKRKVIHGVPELVPRIEATHTHTPKATISLDLLCRGGVCADAELSPGSLRWHIDGENITAFPTGLWERSDQCISKGGIRTNEGAHELHFRLKSLHPERLQLVYTPNGE